MDAGTATRAAAHKARDAGSIAPDATDGGRGTKDGGAPTLQSNESNPGPQGASNQNKPPPTAWLLPLYIGVLFALIATLHVVDSFQAYAFAKDTRDKAFTRLGGSIAGEQLTELFKLAPTGIPGTTRAIFSYGLIVLLGAAVFHLLVFASTDQALGSAEKILTVIAGALSSIIGFYFGSSATKEGVASGAAQRGEAPQASGCRILGVDPSSGAHVGDQVIIVGTGFGDLPGSIQFGDVAVAQADSWKDMMIKARVPKGTSPGATTITVTSGHGAKTSCQYVVL